jgi:starch synthase
MHIAFVASEGVPYSKTGGLADVVGALPRALAALGHQVSVYLPRYRQTKLAEPATVVRSITIPFDDQYRFASVVSAVSQGGVRSYFVEYPPYFDREALYGTPAGDYPDNAERYALFSKPQKFSECRRFFTATTGSQLWSRYFSAPSTPRIPPSVT